MSDELFSPFAFCFPPYWYMGRYAPKEGEIKEKVTKYFSEPLFCVVKLTKWRFFVFFCLTYARTRAPSNSDVDFLLSQVSHKGKIWREKPSKFWRAEKREKRLLVVFSAYFQSLKFVFVKICPIYVVIDWIIVCCLLFCDTCDSKNAKTPGMRLYARARGRDVIGIFTIRIGCSRLLFRGWVFSRSLPFIENNTSFSPKQHVVFTKITRRFY